MDCKRATDSHVYARERRVETSIALRSLQHKPIYGPITFVEPRELLCRPSTKAGYQRNARSQKETLRSACQVRDGGVGLISFP